MQSSSAVGWCAAEERLDFQTVDGDWGGRYVLHLSVDPTNPDRMFAATHDARVLASTDGGKTWRPFGG